VGFGRLKLPLVHVNDVVEGLIAAASRPDVCGAIFHLVDPAPVTQREYIDSCREEATTPIRASYIPRVALLAVGIAFDVLGALIKRNLPLTSYRIRSIKELTFDCTAARRRLGWECEKEEYEEADALIRSRAIRRAGPQDLRRVDSRSVAGPS
jgi:2-alkyl-3-oxoalkanoate reductase